MRKEIICTVCPMGCPITVTGEGDKIEEVAGYTCKKGLEYAANEFAHPVRILTTTVKTKDEKNPLLPVRSEKPVPKEKIMDCMAEVKKVRINKKINRYDVIISDICGTGIDIVATGNY